MSKFYEARANPEKITVGYDHRIPKEPGFKRNLKIFGLLCEIWLMLWVNIRIDYLWQKGYLREHWFYWFSWLTISLLAGITVWTYPWDEVSTPTAIFLFILGWCSYYLLLALFFKARFFEYLWNKVGRAKTIMIFEPMLAVMFLGFMLGFGSLVAATAGRGFSIHEFIGSTLILKIFCVVIWVIGYIFKTWATWLIGMDVFFFRDQILRTPNERLVQSKIYTYFTHPTYSVGYLGVYAYPLWMDSVIGLVGGFLLHCGIFLFVKVAEEPGMKEIYGGFES